MPGPAATISHMHTCPMSSGTTPHVGGPIIGPGVPTVLIGGKPAAVMGDQCTCTGPPDVIAMGCATVLIGGKPAATMGDMTAHGGVITVGEPTVLIGTGGGAPTAVMPVSKIPFPKIKLINKILGNNAQAIANQEALRQQAENTDGEPLVYNLKWKKEETVIHDSKVLKIVTLTADVLNISDGESAEIKILRHKEIKDEEGNMTEEKQEVTTLTGTVKDKMVEVTWEIEEEPNEQ